MYQFQSIKNNLFIALPLTFLFFIASSDAMAATTATTGGLPYEPFLVKLTTSITGPVAFALSLLGIVVAGGVLIFGGELNGFVRSLVLIFLVIGLLVGATNMMSGVFGRSAVITTLEDRSEMDKEQSNTFQLNKGNINGTANHPN